MGAKEQCHSSAFQLTTAGTRVIERNLRNLPNWSSCLQSMLEGSYYKQQHVPELVNWNKS